jgi:hypothetical protein
LPDASSRRTRYLPSNIVVNDGSLQSKVDYDPDMPTALDWLIAASAAATGVAGLIASVFWI